MVVPLITDGAKQLAFSWISRRFAKIRTEKIDIFKLLVALLSLS